MALLLLAAPFRILPFRHCSLENGKRNLLVIQASIREII